MGGHCGYGLLQAEGKSSEDMARDIEDGRRCMGRSGRRGSRMKERKAERLFSSYSSVAVRPPQGGLDLGFWLTAKLKMPLCTVQAKAVGPKPKAPAKAPPAGPAKPGAAARRMRQVT